MKYIYHIVILLFSVISISIPVSAGMFDDFSFSGSFESTYWNHDPDGWNEDEDSLYDGPYRSLENTLSLNLDWQNWFASVRLRSMKYNEPIHYDPRSREHETDLELFKFQTGYRGNNFTVIGGDFYKSLAHGIVLFVQEDEDLNIDRTIRGGAVDVTTNPVDITVFGGEIQWYKFKDDISDKIFDEYKITDKVFGGRAIGRLPGNITLGVSIASAEIFEIIADEYESEGLVTCGVDFEITGFLDGKFDFYAEYATLKWDEDMPFGEETDDGNALYSSLTAYLGDFTVLTEYKDYDYWDYRYSRPPLADREDEESIVDDIRGFRLKVDYFLFETNTLIYLSGSRFDNHSHESSWGTVTRNRIDHVYGGIEQTWDKLYAHLTYGHQKFDALNETHRRGTSDFVYNIADVHSLNLYYEYKFTGNKNPETGQAIAEKDEHKCYLTYSWSPWLSLTAHYNRHIIDKANKPEDKEEWIAGEISWTPISSLAISFIYGELPPGLICSGGQCRIVPAFEGFQAGLTYRF